MIEGAEIRNLLATHGSKAVSFVAEALMEDPTDLNELVAALSTSNTVLSNSAAETVSEIAFEDSEVLYPFFDEVAQLLKSNNEHIVSHVLCSLLWMVDQDNQQKINPYLTDIYNYSKSNNETILLSLVENLPDLEEARPDCNRQVIEQIVDVLQNHLNSTELILSCLDSLDALNTLNKSEDLIALLKQLTISNNQEIKQNAEALLAKLV